MIFTKKTKMIAFSLIFPLICISAKLCADFSCAESALTCDQENLCEIPIKSAEFTPSADAMTDAFSLDLETHQSDGHFNWIEVLAYLAEKYDGDFEKYKKSDLDRLRDSSLRGSVRELANDQTIYDRYFKVYDAVLCGMLGERTVEHSDEDGKAVNREKAYGLMAYYPMAAGYYCSEFDDFGAERIWGYKRSHLGHDMVGELGTPIVAVESGYVEALGWNKYGGWRIGIRSFDNKRYYYYAHLRKGHPYNDMYEGKIVSAGEIIGFLGKTGYSTVEDTDNIVTPHLHIGLQLIFSPEQKEGEEQIWVDFYQISKFLSQNKATAYKDDSDGRFFSSVRLTNPEI